MLTAEDDTPTVRHALHRRLDAESGCRIADIKFIKTPTHMHVYVEIDVGISLNVTGEFDLPNSFEHSHLINEIDEIAEGCKRARREYWLAGCPNFDGRRALPGSGLRGGWKQYG